MIPSNPYVLAAIVAVAVSYWTVEAVKAPVARAAHNVCHVVTIGHKCKDTQPHTVQP